MPVLILFLIALLCACLPTQGQQGASCKDDFTQVGKKVVKNTLAKKQ